MKHTDAMTWWERNRYVEEVAAHTRAKAREAAGFGKVRAYYSGLGESGDYCYVDYYTPELVDGLQRGPGFTT